MIFNSTYIKIALVLCIFHDVASHPKRGVDSGNAKDASSRVKKPANPKLKSAGNLQGIKNKDNHKYGREGDAIVRSLKLNDGDIEGHIELNDKLIHSNTNIEPDNSDQPKDDSIKGNIKINVGNVEGHVEIPGDVINEQDAGVEQSTKKVSIKYENIGDNTNNQQKKNDIKGEIIMDDETIDGLIQLPSDLDANFNEFNLNEDGTNSSNSKGPKPEIYLTESGEGHGDADTISGNIKVDDDGNMEGSINLPDNDDIDLGNDNNGQGGNDDEVNGSVEIKDDGSIEGTIGIPDLIYNDQSDTGNGNQPDPENGDLPDAMNHNEGQGDDKDTFTGSIEMNADGIVGTVNLPDKNDNGNVPDNDDIQPDAENDDIAGEIKIDDEGNVEGHIATGPDDKGVNTETFDNSKGTPSKNPPRDSQSPPKPFQNQSKQGKTCWMNLNSKFYLDALDQIDAKYNKARRQYHDEVGSDFDKQMMEVLLSSQGKAPRAIHQAHGNPNVIPAGLNLGGFGMMRMPGSMLFFHRMKLRNDTIFRVDFLETNLMDMSLVARLSLNDLHLRGSYERATTEDGMASMYFVPTYGELDLLIRTVNYKMEGRLRMLNNRLMIELVNSVVLSREILLSYANSTVYGKNIQYDSIEDFIGRLKCDLDIWLKDYFNDYLMYFGIVGAGKNAEIHLYEKEKTMKANEYADHAIKGIKRKLRSIKSANVKLPSFTLMSVMNHKIDLKNGVLRGLDSIYRRSVAMTKTEKTIRILDVTIGFSNLKVEYQYEASVMRGMPPLAGSLILTADELTAHLEISQVGDSQVVDMKVDSIIQLKSEFLTVEGPANRLIADFKYILENPIIALITNVMKHNIKMLKTLTRCEPSLWSDDREYNPYSNDKDDTFIPPQFDDVNFREKKSENNYNAQEMNAFSDETDKKNDFVKTANQWSDYTFSKNDSVEIEVPINSKKRKLKLNRNENFMLSKVP